MLEDIIEITLSMSCIIILMLILSRFLDKKYKVGWKYWIWLIIAIRLIIPFNLSLQSAPIQLPNVENDIIVYQKNEQTVTGNNGENIVIPNEYVQVNITKEQSNSVTAFDTYKISLIIWFSVAIIFFGYYILSYLFFKRKILKFCEPYRLENKYKRMEKIKVFKCSKISTPMIIGFINHIMILPDIDYTINELDIIVKHELVHYKRHDLWYKLILIIAQCMHWFNPFVYLMVKQANQDLEYSCDDIVVNNENIDFKKQYTTTILKSMKLKGE